MYGTNMSYRSKHSHMYNSKIFSPNFLFFYKSSHHTQMSNIFTHDFSYTRNSPEIHRSPPSKAWRALSVRGICDFNSSQQKIADVARWM